jgi:predicted nucleotidyltransferase
MKKESAMSVQQEFLYSSHPIDPAMREQVMANLRAIEAQHNVTILFACESGSRGWGFASPDSDYDVRFIYVNRLPWYLTVAPGRDVIELPISGDLDINGWDLRKALGLMRESNPTLLEWLRSPIVYREEAETMARFRALAGHSRLHRSRAGTQRGRTCDSDRCALRHDRNRRVAARHRAALHTPDQRLTTRPCKLFIPSLHRN